MNTNELIQITDKALDQIQTIFESEGKDYSKGLRLAVVGGGCSGLQYKIEFSEPKDKDNILLIKEYGNVPRCVQRGVEKAGSPLFFLTVDDCIFAKDSIDLAMDKYKEVCSKNDVIGS